MKMTRSADFAMRIVVFLATENKAYTMPELAEKLVIPYNNLSKLVQYLSKASILQTKQGKNGGVQLLKPPTEISVKDVVDVIDGPTRLSDCLTDSRFCTLTHSCKLKGTFHSIQTQIDAILNGVSIQQIIYGDSDS